MLEFVPVITAFVFMLLNEQVTTLLDTRSSNCLMPRTFSNLKHPHQLRFVHFGLKNIFLVFLYAIPYSLNCDGLSSNLVNITYSTNTLTTWNC